MGVYSWTWFYITLLLKVRNLLRISLLNCIHVGIFLLNLYLHQPVMSCLDQCTLIFRPIPIWISGKRFTSRHFCQQLDTICHFTAFHSVWIAFKLSDRGHHNAYLLSQLLVCVIQPVSFIWIIHWELDLAQWIILLVMHQRFKGQGL